MCIHVWLKHFRDFNCVSSADSTVLVVLKFALIPEVNLDPNLVGEREYRINNTIYNLHGSGAGG